MVVVGTRGDQVLDTISEEYSGVLYVHQEPQLGTGHAAKVAAEALQVITYQGYILVTMGDKYLEENALAALVDGYVKQRADVALLIIPKTPSTENLGRPGDRRREWSGAGHHRTHRSGPATRGRRPPRFAGQRGIGDRAGRAPRIERHIPMAEKRAVAVGELLALSKSPGIVEPAKLDKILQAGKYNLEIAGKRYSAKQIDRLSAGVNPSLYLMRADVFYQAVGMIRNDNAQGEYYITDMVRLLSGVRDSQGRPRYRVCTVAVDHPEWVQGFNSPDELLVIQDYARQKRLAQRETQEVVNRPQLKPARYCYGPPMAGEDRGGAAGHAPLVAARSTARKTNLHQQKCTDLRGVLECYGKRFGMDEKVCIVRAPGRVNLMGRHVDHRGGMTNFLAIDRETLAVVGLRRTMKWWRSIPSRASTSRFTSRSPS